MGVPSRLRSALGGNPLNLIRTIPAEGGMIVIYLNGEEKSFSSHLSIQQILAEVNISPKAIAVAVNSEIVPRSQFEKIKLRNHDRLEIIHAVGGG